MLLSKGCEIELYTGHPDGTIVGLSDHIVQDLAGFVREPDSRNVEYTTAPFSGYDRLLCALVRPRQQLRRYVTRYGDYTLHPGSTLSLGDTRQFFRSDPNNPYHAYIEQTYHTTVVTASVHINIGIDDPDLLMRAYRLIRLEAPLYLALSASSPFLDGQPTGFHSTRWAVFPQTPDHVPLFTSHADFVHWTEEQLRLGTMQNVRHLWVSVRPNGDRRPYNLNRLELRICDLVSNPISLLAIVAFLEARLTQLLTDERLDPLTQSQFTPDELLALTVANEQAAAKHSLAATLRHWQDGRSLTAADWIDQIYETVWPTAKQRSFSCFLSPLRKILSQGNEAQRWLAQYEQGQSPQQIMQGAIAAMAQAELELQEKLCVEMAV
ncbi:glutamate--cysteine ligase [Spirulina major CS-329]|uniref:glutamate--cysteine ligase n=1 Tax=Spirulina TaxID=1154 RepID=UPI002330E209|nr:MULTISPECIES: glutamate--cysteine ligase [Spirulina]MDB9496781.1 glutamate--cysteine ligase [Spirulina subsalsa CS-330]MDB9505127.1 glutamate--cysteine ligase [Spirulina major CS-329]